MLERWCWRGENLNHVSSLSNIQTHSPIKHRYKTGNIKERLERAKKIKEAEYAKHTFKPNVGRRKAQNTSSAGSIHERLHQAAARRSAQRKAAMQKKAEEEEKKFATKKKKKPSSGSDVYVVFEREA
jgi:5-carboxymethyl-2-hydroxymuconate isomerase